LAALGYFLKICFIPWFVADISRLQKWFDVDILAIQIEVWVEILSFLGSEI